MIRFSFLFGIILTLSKLEIKADAPQAIEDTDQSIWELSEHQFILACTILAIGIFILVCIFGILICLSEMNEFKEHKMSIVSPAEIYKMTKLEEVKEEPTKASPSAQSEG